MKGELARAGWVHESSCVPEGLEGASLTWETRCHDDNYSNADQALALLSQLEDEVPRRRALYCPVHSGRLCLVELFGK